MSNCGYGIVLFLFPDKKFVIKRQHVIPLAKLGPLLMLESRAQLRYMDLLIPFTSKLENCIWYTISLARIVWKAQPECDESYRTKYAILIVFIFSRLSSPFWKIAVPTIRWLGRNACKVANTFFAQPRKQAARKLKLFSKAVSIRHFVATQNNVASIKEPLPDCATFLQLISLYVFEVIHGTPYLLWIQFSWPLLQAWVHIHKS